MLAWYPSVLNAMCDCDIVLLYLMSWIHYSLYVHGVPLDDPSSFDWMVRKTSQREFLGMSRLHSAVVARFAILVVAKSSTRTKVTVRGGKF